MNRLRAHPYSALFGLLMLALLATPATAQNARRDGNYWVLMPQGDKLNYIIGFFDGMDLGSRFSYWSFVSDPNKADAARAAMDSYGKYTDKFFSNVTNSQLVEGLDKFYADFQNRRIRVEYGVWLVVNQIAGTPDVDKMILSWRQHAQ